VQLVNTRSAERQRGGEEAQRRVRRHSRAGSGVARAREREAQPSPRAEVAARRTLGGAGVADVCQAAEGPARRRRARG
jgi:hypothetical protein